MMFDASSVFKDLGISDYKIIRDFNGDGEQDKQNNVATTFVYNEAKLYNIYNDDDGIAKIGKSEQKYIAENFSENNLLSLLSSQMKGEK